MLTSAEKPVPEPSASTRNHSQSAAKITVAAGDGIGPEITAAALSIMVAGGALLDVDMVEVGEKVYLAGETSGIPNEAWHSIERTGVMLKGPITTPQGGGYKSLNVTMRKTLGLYANVRPCRTYKPVIETRHPNMDVVIVRENEEDLYAGIEHRQTADVRQCLKLVTRSGCERIVRYAFEYAAREGRRKITCMTKDNIMKMTDGLFHKVFDEIAADYPQMETNHQIIDFGMANFVHRPDAYDVIVTLNLYGDILSDIAAQMTGSVGLGGSVNIGNGAALFEAIHGSAPDLPRDVANPSGILLAGVEMLRHLGQHDAAARTMNAWLCTLEDGIHTGDIAGNHTRVKAGTREFTYAVIERMGREPKVFAKAAVAVPGTLSLNLPAHAHKDASRRTEADEKKTLTGVDVFLRWMGQGGATALAAALQQANAAGGLRLEMITNRGVMVWPKGHASTLCTDHWRCRFRGDEVTAMDIPALLRGLIEAGLEPIKSENLYLFDGKPGFSLGQGQ